MVLHREKLSNLAYQAIKDMIADHRFQPGTRINVEKLTKELGCSRTPIWEAVGRLEQEGLVQNVPNRGVFMLELDYQDTLNLYQVREVLEALAARLAAERIDARALALMRKNLDKQVKVVEQVDMVAYSRLDFDFHAAIYAASGNPFLQENLESIKNKMRPLTTRLQDMLPDLYQDHILVLSALEAGDPARAEAALGLHNKRMIDLVRRKIAEGEQDYKGQAAG